MKSLFKSLLIKGSFAQNVGITSSAKIIVMTLSFIFVPILSRLYPPEAYGSFALYNSVTTILVLIGLMGYPNAYVLIKKEDHFRGLLTFQLISISALSVISIIAVFLIYKYTNFTSGMVLWFVPFGVFINGLITIFSNWMVRNKDFRIAAMLESGGELIIRVVNLLIGIFASAYQYGLILGNMSGRLLVDAINAIRYFVYNDVKFEYFLNFKVVKQTLLEWIQYPKYILPNQLVLQFGSQMPVYFIILLFGGKELGYYSMALTLFSIPIQLFSNAIAPVYLQKAHELYSGSFNDLRIFTSKLLRFSQILIFIPIVILVVFSKEIVPFFLGPNWGPTSIVISIIALYIFLEILITPISSIFQVVRKENILLGLNLFSFVIIALFMGLSAFLEFEFFITIALLTGARAISQLVRGFLICHYLKLSFIKVIGLPYGLLIFVATVSFLIKY